MSRISDYKIKNLGKSIFDRYDQDQDSYTLLLGAGASISSNCPSWEKLCEKYCDEYSIKPHDNNFIYAFQEKLSRQSSNTKDIYLAFAKFLNDVEPSIGYFHLATLISKGVFKTIITTNFDNLLEKALSKVMSISDIKVLVRGEVTDEYIANFIEKGIPKVKIIKLHGDLQSNIFFYKDENTFKVSDRLESVLKKEISSGSVIVGSEMSDSDLLGIYHVKSYNVFVNPKEPNDLVRKVLNLGKEKDNLQIISNKKKEGKKVVEKLKSGEFDVFFTELNLEFHRHFIRQKGKEREYVEKSILDKQEKGASYINYSRLGHMVGSFWNEIMFRYNDNKNFPDAIIFINDPTAPGGMELKRRMVDLIHKHHEDVLIETIKIEGIKQTRYYKRKVTSKKPVFNFKSKRRNRNILILDAISFSGNTIKIAIKKYQEWFPTYTIRGGIMVIDDQLKKNIESGEENTLKETIYSMSTDRHEIFFPWGVTQATSDCHRELKGIDTVYPVTISKRPWGSIEVLTQQKNCSVRILTIEADQKLSFQRHLVRDEFFISLDENVGLEICSETLEDLPEKVDINDIKEIKSLVLEKGDYVLIPKGIWHRTKASKGRARLLEIGYGAYDQDKDIERIDDKFGRINLDGSE